MTGKKDNMTAENRFREAMAHAGYAPAQAAAAPALNVVPPRALVASEIDLGCADDTGVAVGLDLPRLLEGRLLVQGNSGAGKSWTLRRILEQTSGQVAQIIVDPEGEFAGFADRFGHLRLAAERLDPAHLAVAAGRAREHRLSLVVDFSELEREQQLICVASLCRALIAAPEDQWGPCLVAIDEAHLFAPMGDWTQAAPSIRREAVGSLTDLMSRGRKRGLAGILATQRLARLAKSVLSEASNFLIGHNTLDLDIRRAAETIGWDARRAFDRLPMLDPGDFVCVGPAFSRSPAVLRVGPVDTAPPASRFQPPAEPAFLDPNRAAELLGLDSLVEAAERDAETLEGAHHEPGLRAVRQFIRDPAFASAGRIWNALQPLAPEGAAVAALAGHLGIDAAMVKAALALLDGYGVLEFTGEGEDMAVRITKGMTS